MLPVLDIPDKKWAASAADRDSALRKRAPGLQPAHVATWHGAPLLVQDKVQPWMVLPYDQDPLRTKDGGYPFPKLVKRELETLIRRGVDFDTLAIAHELDPKGAVAPLLGRIPGAGLLCDAESTKALIGPAPATQATKRVAGTLNRAGDVMADVGPKALLALAIAPLVVAAAPLALLAAAGSAIDPIVFGVLHVDHDAQRQVSLWYPLAAWKW